jgi:FAD synthetase
LDEHNETVKDLQNEQNETAATVASLPPAEKRLGVTPPVLRPDCVDYSGDSSVPLHLVTADLHARVQSFLAESCPPDSLLHRAQEQTRISLSVVELALSQYKLAELSLSYNGGKDCLVLLVLILAALHPLAPPEKGGISSIPAIYALPPYPFASIEGFVRSSAQAYHLSLTRYMADPPRTTLRAVFESYLARNPSIKAIFVGTRRTDPHGAKLTHFDRTDHGWPDFVRIHPVIDWHYAEIWALIRHLGIEYCCLYDEGYTSLGGTNDTQPNPKLKVDARDQPDAGPKYRPAYKLLEDDEERLGRH